ncbi:MAG: hypothetical protein H7X97_07935 [Opitutaceae bacterium]|nr:hypothetical protein [Verrucomicrobiales bacterium]
MTTKISELQKVQSQIRCWRTTTVIVVIAVVVGCVLMISNSVKQLAQDGPPQQEFFKELSTGLRADVLPQVQSIASQTANQMMPIIQAELKKLNDRAPDIADAARKELELLAKNVPEKAESILEESFSDILKKRESRIRQLYPDVTEAKVSELIKNLVTVTEERAANLVETQFASHIVGLNHIHDNLHKIYLSEAGAIQQEVANWEMALLFFDVIREEIRPLESLDPTKPKQ